MPHIDYYFSVTSPWAYIGHPVFADVARAHRCTVTYKPVLLPKLFPETGGLTLDKRHPLRQQYRMIELQRWRDKRGLTFNLQPKYFPFDPTVADCMVIAAAADGHEVEPFVRLCMKSVWEAERNLADLATLRELAESCGLPAAKLLERAATDPMRAAYERNRLDAIKDGVVGSPGFVLNGEPFWGQDRIELLADALRSGRGPYRAEV